MEELKEVAQGTTKALVDKADEIVARNSRNIFSWLNKLRIHHLPLNFNVALSIKHKKNGKSLKFFNEITKQLLSIVDQHGLSEQVKIKDISDIHFTTTIEAEKFREKKGLNLIIWGEFSEEGLKIDGKELTSITLNFTFSHPDNIQKQVAPMVLLDIYSHMASKPFPQISEENSFTDIQLVSINIFDISLYIIALSFKLWGRISESILLFEKLFLSLNNRKDILSIQLIPHVINCYELFTIYLVLDKKDYSGAILLCNKILQFDEKNQFALSNLAKLHYENGNKQESEKYINLLAQFHPGKPVTELDLAFLKIIKQEYKSAHKHYRKLVDNYTRIEELGFNVINVIEFLEEYSIKTNEVALLYGSGILSYYYGDKEVALKDLELFLEKFNENDQKRMYREAKHLVSTIKIDLKQE